MARFRLDEMSLVCLLAVSMVIACTDDDFNCVQQCGRCQSENLCWNIDGDCQSDCEDGYLPSSCPGCREGHYGPDCKRCGQCLDNSPCGKQTGHCPLGCQPGWKGDNCHETCSDGYYVHGSDCRRCGQCLYSSPCDKGTGRCPQGCQLGWKGDNCQTGVVAKSGTVKVFDHTESRSPLSVDGNPEVTRDGNLTSCVSITGRQPSWKITFDKEHTIFGVGVYIDEGNLTTINILVDGDFCFHGFVNKMYTKCFQPEEGKSVTINVPFGENINNLTLCEVDVNVKEDQILSEVPRTNINVVDVVLPVVSFLGVVLVILCFNRYRRKTKRFNRSRTDNRDISIEAEEDSVYNNYEVIPIDAIVSSVSANSITGKTVVNFGITNSQLQESNHHNVYDVIPKDDDIYFELEDDLHEESIQGETQSPATVEIVVHRDGGFHSEENTDPGLHDLNNPNNYELMPDGPHGEENQIQTPSPETVGNNAKAHDSFLVEKSTDSQKTHPSNEYILVDDRIDGREKIQMQIPSPKTAVNNIPAHDTFQTEGKSSFKVEESNYHHSEDMAFDDSIYLEPEDRPIDNGTQMQTPNPGTVHNTLYTKEEFQENTISQIQESNKHHDQQDTVDHSIYLEPVADAIEDGTPMQIPNPEKVDKDLHADDEHKADENMPMDDSIYLKPVCGHGEDETNELKINAETVVNDLHNTDGCQDDGNTNAQLHDSKYDHYEVIPLVENVFLELIADPVENGTQMQTPNPETVDKDVLTSGECREDGYDNVQLQESIFRHNEARPMDDNIYLEPVSDPAEDETNELKQNAETLVNDLHNKDGCQDDGNATQKLQDSKFDHYEVIPMVDNVYLELIADPAENGPPSLVTVENDVFTNDECQEDGYANSQLLELNYRPDREVLSTEGSIYLEPIADPIEDETRELELKLNAEKIVNDLHNEGGCQDEGHTNSQLQEPNCDHYEVIPMDGSFCLEPTADPVESGTQMQTLNPETVDNDGFASEECQADGNDNSQHQ